MMNQQPSKAAHIFTCTLLATLVGCGGTETPEGQISELEELQDPSHSGELEVDTSESELSFNTALNLCDGGTNCSIYGAQFAGIHCCPSGYAMFGAHVGANVFYCRQVTGGFTNIYINNNTYCDNIHCCEFGEVMIGYHEDNDDLVCATPSTQSVSFEYVDSTTASSCDALSMHTCATTGNPNAYAMSGIDPDENDFLCAR